MVHILVPSDRVEAASVYGRDGQKIGRIERLMLEKMTGVVAYAVVATAPRSTGIRNIGRFRLTSLARGDRGSPNRRCDRTAPQCRSAAALIYGRFRRENYGRTST
jgi:PRC-barrel domain